MSSLSIYTFSYRHKTLKPYNNKNSTNINNNNNNPLFTHKNLKVYNNQNNTNINNNNNLFITHKNLKTISLKPFCSSSNDSNYSQFQNVEKLEKIQKIQNFEKPMSKISSFFIESIVTVVLGSFVFMGCFCTKPVLSVEKIEKLENETMYEKTGKKSEKKLGSQVNETMHAENIEKSGKSVEKGEKVGTQVNETMHEKNVKEGKKLGSQRNEKMHENSFEKGKKLGSQENEKSGKNGEKLGSQENAKKYAKSVKNNEKLGTQESAKKYEKGEKLGSQESAKKYEKSEKLGSQESATMYEKSEKFGSQEKETMYEMLLEINPRDVETLKVVFHEKMAKGKIEEAVLYVEKLIDVEPNEIEWRLLQALCYEMLGKLSKAKRLFKDILAERPLLLRALHGLAMVMHKNREGPAVFEMLNRALELARREKRVTEERNIRILIAQMHVVKGDLEEGLKNFQALVDENPRDFRPYLCQGIIYSLMDKKNEAEEQFGIYRSLVPDEFPQRGFLDDVVLAAKTSSHEQLEKEFQAEYSYKSS